VSVDDDLDRRDDSETPAPPGGAAGSRTRSSRIALKLSILPVLAGIGFVLLHGAAGIGRDTSKKIHDLRNPASCAHCHPAGDHDTLIWPDPVMCLRCHEEEIMHGMSHPVGIPVTVNTDPALLLLAGKMVCSTCHDPHGKTRHPNLLRRTGLGLCMPCHPEQGESQHFKHP
jgi:predicted CXXCH cytochrome family protein